MQHPIREHVASLTVGSELDFVDREKVHRAIEGHRFDGAQPIARTIRDTLLLAGDERHLALADPHRDPVVQLSSQQAQGQTDHPAAVAEHALDRTMGLSCVGWAEQRSDGAACLRAAVRHVRSLLHTRSGGTLGAGPAGFSAVGR